MSVHKQNIIGEIEIFLTTNFILKLVVGGLRGREFDKKYSKLIAKLLKLQ